MNTDVDFVTPDFADAASVYTAIHERLRQALASSKFAFHLMTLANNGPEGPEARTVVMRAIDPVARWVSFHTDRRSAKFGQLQEDPRVTLVWYDPAIRCQIRMPAMATVHSDDEIARSAWDASRPDSRSCYAVVAGPGSVLDLDAPYEIPLAVEADDARAFANFAVVRCQFRVIDVVFLRAGGHRRARLEWHNHDLRLTRLAP